MKARDEMCGSLRIYTAPTLLDSSVSFVERVL
jgi:hypothetical protein